MEHVASHLAANNSRNLSNIFACQYTKNLRRRLWVKKEPNRHEHGNDGERDDYPFSHGREKRIGWVRAVSPLTST